MAALEIALLTAFKKEIIKGLKITKDELSNLFDDNLQNYLEKQRQKHSYVRTFIFRDKDMELSKVYFPLRLSEKRGMMSDKDIMPLFENNNCISITGIAGSGKTMLVSKLFIDCITQKIKIPFIIQLRAFNNYNGTFINYIYEKLLNKKVKPSTKILERAFESGKFIFFLDGYDELYSENSSRVTDEVNEFIEIYNDNYFLITSRPGTSLEYFNTFKNLNVQALSKNEIHKFISLQTSLLDDELLGIRINETIEKPENKDYKEFLSNPLLLSMFIFTYGLYPEIPKTKSKFYWNVWDTLCFKHDIINKKQGHLQDRTSGLTTDQIEEIVKWVSFKSLIKGKYEFEEMYLSELIKEIKQQLGYSFEIKKLIYDLRTSISILLLDGTEFRFPHKSLQEYFSVLLISKLNEPQKKEVYSNYLKQYLDNTEYDNLNFLQICKEIDKKAFFEYFIIKNLDPLIKSLKKENEYKSFCSVLNFFVHRIYINDQFSAIGSWHYVAKYQIVAIKVLGIEPQHLMSLSRFDGKITKPINNLLQDFIRKSKLVKNKNEDDIDYNTYVITSFSKIDMSLYDILEKIGYVKVVLTLIDDIGMKVQKIKEELNREKNNITNLLHSNINIP